MVIRARPSEKQAGNLLSEPSGVFMPDIDTDVLASPSQATTPRDCSITSGSSLGTDRFLYSAHPSHISLPANSGLHATAFCCRVLELDRVLLILQRCMPHLFHLPAALSGMQL